MTAPLRHRHAHAPSPPRLVPLGRAGSPARAPSPPPVRRADGSIWSRLAAANRRLEDSWLGDAIGAVFLFGAGYGLFVIAGVLG